MITNRTKQIAAIIEKRRPLAKKIERVQRNIQNLSSGLKTLDRYREQFAKIAEPEVAGRLKDIGISLSTVQTKIADEVRELDKLKCRFSRETLNIGVVGRARQGKSRLLQSLSGLTSIEIPDGRHQHCTGVRSTIYHNPDVTPYAEIKFYSAKEFLDTVIAPYYDERHLHLGPPPYTLDDFAAQPLPTLSSDLLHYAGAKAKYDHLKGYWDNLSKYRSLLNESTSRIILKKEVIREYVAQDTLDGQRIYSNYRAVQEVRVVCKFPHQDVGQIALIDMPGLGDTGVGDQERLIKALGEDIDIVLFVRMPKALGDHWAEVDIQLYDLARSALTHLPIELWSFMILNRIDAQSDEDNNTALCSALRDTITSDVHISVVDAIIANCANTTEVGSQVLERILDYLTANITTLDKKYASSCQERLFSLQREIREILKEAEKALGEKTTSKEEARLFRKLFKELWDDLTAGLEGLVRELEKKRNVEDPLYQGYIDAALQACEHDPIPSLEEIERRRDRVGGYSRAYSQFLDEIRTRLTLHFTSLDDALKHCIDEVKKQVAVVLINDGQLGDLIVTRDGTQPLHAKNLLDDTIVGQTAALRSGTEFLTTIERLIPDDLQNLKQPFQILASCELSYRGFIQYRIRRNLNGLTPDLTRFQISNSPSAQEVQNYLKGSHDRTIFELQKELKEKSRFDTSEVAFAIVEEFKDQFLRSEDAEDNCMSFYEEISASVWPDKFRELGEKSYMRKQWRESLERVLLANQTDCFRFLD